MLTEVSVESSILMALASTALRCYARGVSEESGSKRGASRGMRC